LSQSDALKTVQYIAKLRKKFSSRQEFSKSELYRFLKEANPELQPASYNKKLYNWKKAGILREVLSGVYQFDDGKKTEFTPQVSVTLRKLNKAISKEFPLIDYCIWETRWLSGFMHHIPQSNLILIEVGDEAEEMVFNYFMVNNSKMINKRSIFLNPDRKELNQKVWNSQECIIVRRLVSRAPTQVAGEIPVPGIEKILVDLFCDTDLFMPFQGTDLDQVFSFADEFNKISWPTALSYAGRRGKMKEFGGYLLDLNLIPKATIKQY